MRTAAENSLGARICTVELWAFTAAAVGRARLSWAVAGGWVAESFADAARRVAMASMFVIVVLLALRLLEAFAIRPRAAAGGVCRPLRYFRSQLELAVRGGPALVRPLPYALAAWLDGSGRTSSGGMQCGSRRYRRATRTRWPSTLRMFGTASVFSVVQALQLRSGCDRGQRILDVLFAWAAGHGADRDAFRARLLDAGAVDIDTVVAGVGSVVVVRAGAERLAAYWRTPMELACCLRAYHWKTVLAPSVVSSNDVMRLVGHDGAGSRGAAWPCGVAARPVARRRRLFRRYPATAAGAVRRDPVRRPAVRGDAVP